MATAPCEFGTGTVEPACVSAVVALDFQHKTERVLSWAEARGAIDQGHFVWVDILARDRPEARRVLESFEALESEVIEAALQNEPSTQHARYEHCLHVVVSECRALGSGFELGRLDVVLSERWLLTIHATPIALLGALRKSYKSDFVRFAKSPSFLLYEIWDHLLDGYLNVQKLMEERVEQLQDELRSERVSDQLFARL